MSKKRFISERQRIDVLERDDYICVYCLGNATTVDHVVPWEYSYCRDEDNLVAACSDCNSIASDFVFDNFDIKSEYIRTKRAGLKWGRKLRKKLPPRCGTCGKIFIELNNGANLLLCSNCFKKEYNNIL